MPEAMTLLDGFAGFYQEVSALRQAARKGALPAWLAEPGLAPPATPQELAQRVQARLLACLERQQRRFARHATASELRAYHLLRLVMAALADEVLLLETDWDGAAAWLGLLLETKLFRTSDAGSRLFDLADQLLGAANRNALHRQLAAALLLALQLGFKGRWRGDEAHLYHYRRQLYRLAQDAADDEVHAFAPAYASCLRLAPRPGRAPLRPWLRAAAYTAAACLLLSGLCWLWQVSALLTFLGQLPSLN